MFCYIKYVYGVIEWGVVLEWKNFDICNVVR